MTEKQVREAQAEEILTLTIFKSDIQEACRKQRQILELTGNRYLPLSFLEDIEQLAVIKEG